VARSGAMTRGVGRIDWAALRASLGWALLVTGLFFGPFLLGAHYSLWLYIPAIAIILAVYLYLRRDRYAEPGPDADETRFHDDQLPP
jgi:hypothetical protein